VPCSAYKAYTTPMLFAGNDVTRMTKLKPLLPVVRLGKDGLFGTDGVRDSRVPLPLKRFTDPFYP